jgi:hypothetical protein
VTRSVDRFNTLDECERILLVDCLKVRLAAVKGMLRTLTDMKEQRGLSKHSQEMCDRYDEQVKIISKLLSQLR